MEDEATPTESEEDPPEAATDSKDLSAMIGKLGTPELLLGIGAAALVADYLLFELILRDYFFFVGTLLVAGYVLFAIWVRHNRPSASWPVPYDWLLRVLGFSAGALGLLEFLTDIRFDTLNGASEVFGALLVYAGVIAMSWGAFQLKK